MERKPAVAMIFEWVCTNFDTMKIDINRCNQEENLIMVQREHSLQLSGLKFMTIAFEPMMKTQILGSQSVFLICLACRLGQVSRAIW